MSAIKKTWQQLVCHTTKQSNDVIEDAMQNAGALSITWKDAEDDPVLEPLPGEQRLWENLIIIALFEADVDLSLLNLLLETNKLNWTIKQFHTETIQDKDWERVWMKDFHPMKFGNNLWIYPSNHDIPDNDDNDDNADTKIHLDPGLAFGTGTHPTTALCLEWLDANHPQNLNVVDYGCGSGILAIAAVKLGASHVVATDIDPQGLIATRDNMLRNDILESLISCYLPDKCPTQAVDLVIANILCGPLIELFPRLSALTRSGGQLVLSGLLTEQKDQLIDTYSSEFNNFDVKVLDNWVRITAIKK